MAHDSKCVFCKIARGEFSSARVLETDRALAFLDISPVNKGHTLLVPKDHHQALPELPDDLAGHVATLLPRLCRAVRAASGAEGLNVVINVGAVAGQTVDHVHWHIIPRFAGDAVHWPWPHLRYDEGEMEQMRARVEQALGEA